MVVMIVMPFGPTAVRNFYCVHAESHSNHDRHNTQLETSEQLVKPPTELRVLQPPTEFGEYMWVNKQNIKN